MITFGLFDAIFSLLFGALARIIGRVPIFIIGASLNFIVIGVLFNWVPHPEDSYLYFILAEFWGIADAVWQSQRVCEFRGHSNNT